MLNFKRAGWGFALAFAPVPLFAQSPTPAASLGRIVSVEQPTPAAPQQPGVTQAAGASWNQAVRPQGVYVQAQTNTPTLPMPRPTIGPGVQEIRDPNNIPGMPVTPVFPQQVPYQPGMVYPYQGGAGMPQYVQPAPVVGQGMPGNAVPVQPGAPIYAGDPNSFDNSLIDPYLGPGSTLFPRVRQAVTGGGGGGRLTLQADYLLWFIKAQPTPALVTTSSPAFNGIIGQGDTRVLFGNQALGDTQFSGGRFGGTYWFRNSNWGLDGNFFFLGRNGGSFTTNSSENPLIARPFIRADTGAQFSELVAFPGLANGSVAVNYGTEMLGGDINFRRPLFCGCNSRLDALIGYRNVSFLENLNITEAFSRTPNGIPAGQSDIASGLVEDRFRTENRFHGVNLGLAGELRRGRWFANMRGSIGLGSVYQSLEIAGAQKLVTTAGTTRNAEGGLLALPGANMGTFTQRRYGFAPEASLMLGYYITPNLRFGVGYNFLYLNSVLRPADQVDTVVDLNRIPNFPVTPAPGIVNPVRPRAIPLKTTEVYATGITFSLQWTW